VTLVKFVGGPDSYDNTGEIRLADGPEGPRILKAGGEPMDLAGDELKAVLGSGYEIEIIEDSASTPAVAPAPPPQPSPPPLSSSSSATPADSGG
jgi:hypothetical protein